MGTGDVLRKLFDEKKINILSLFHTNPQEQFYLREIAERTGVSPATTYRILQQLDDLELVAKTTKKTSKLYKLAENQVNKELKDLLKEEKDPLDLFVSHVRDRSGVNKLILHEKSDDTNNVLVVGNDLDSEAINDKATEMRKKHDFSLVVLTLSQQQFNQMSDMGLFPGNKETLWEE